MWSRMKHICSEKVWSKFIKTILCLSALMMTMALCSCSKDNTAETSSGISSDAVSTVSETERTQLSQTSEAISQPEESSQTESGGHSETKAAEKMQMFINGQPVNVEWDNNSSVQALKQLAASNKLTIQMSMYGGFEQVGSIGTSLPREDVQTTTKAGDIVLYSGNRIVVFYGSNSWAYTRLGHITDKTADEMTELLGNGNVTITLSMTE